MIPIQNTLVSNELIEKKFVCDLQRCKGACCVQGESGAPLEEEELEIIEKIYPYLNPYLTAEGIQAIEQKGLYEMDADGDWVTPLIGDKGACAYTIYEKGIAQCGIEKAFKDGKTDFQKPVSCHLYPVRVAKYKNYDAVNYHKWEICTPACSFGKQMKVPVFQFVKNALIRKFGKEWFGELENFASAKDRKKNIPVEKFS